MHIAKSGTINMSISNPNKLLLHHPQIIIHCQGSHPTVPAQQQSTREYRSSILKVRWNKPCGMVLLVRGAAQQDEPKERPPPCLI